MLKLFNSLLIAHFTLAHMIIYLLIYKSIFGWPADNKIYIFAIVASFTSYCLTGLTNKIIIKQYKLKLYGDTTRWIKK